MMAGQVPAEAGMLKLSDLQDPPYVAVIQSGPRIDQLLYEIRGGKCILTVIVARKDGLYYPVGGLDVLEAHRVNSSELVPCMITDTDDLLGAHMVHTRGEAADPVRVLEYMSSVRDSGGSLRTFPSEYVNMGDVRLAEGMRARLSSYIRGLAERHDEAPSTFHILPALSRLEGAEQEAALEAIIGYSALGGFPPDRMALKKIVSAHRKGGVVIPRVAEA